MNQPKNKIEIRFTAYASYTELWPQFYLTDKPEVASENVEIKLTEVEVKDYRETMRKFYEWQETIKKLAFPGVEDF